MWAFIFRRLLYNIPVYLGIILLVMLALRVQDPVYAFLGKSPDQAQYDRIREDFGLNRPFVVQYVDFVKKIVTLDFSERSWDKRMPVNELIATSIPPTLLITLPQLILTGAIAISIGLIAAFFRGRGIDKTLVFLTVLGMSVSYLVYIVMGQYFGAYWLNQKLDAELFAVQGYDERLSTVGFWAGSPVDALGQWVRYCALPVMIGVIVAIGYDTRFYRAVMVEETNRDYITTAKAKGVGRTKIMFVHMLKNALIPIITRIMITLPFVITGSILVEYYFNIPGMGRTLIEAIRGKDFPVVQTFTALFAAVFIISIILTDVLYALVDPRVRLK
ncbi:MAG: ABC transporter permease [Phycisphaerales bacterium]|nr:MAG: ABC transporter permease [Phycisphaerales bacterium]